MKLILATVLIVVVTLNHASAQTTPEDSARIIRWATRDARTFRLNTADLKKFRAENFPSMSDHFKPTAASTSRAQLLNDSLYVQTFRDAAFYNTINRRRPSLHDILVLRRPGQAGYEPDYSRPTEKTAKKDAGEFWLNDKLFEKFTDGHFPNTSDYFKPTAAYTHDARLLGDSSYVKAFRTAAFYQTLNRPPHPGRTALIVGGSIVVALVGFMLVLFALTHHN